MADKKISELTGATTPLAGTEELPLVQGGVTKKVAASNFLLPSDIGSTVQAYDADTTKNDVSNTFTGVQVFPAGTVTDPSITTTGDTDTGLFFPSADSMAITVGGVEVARGGSGRFGVDSTVLRMPFSLGGGGITQYWEEIPVDTATEIARATGLANNANRGAAYRVTVVGTVQGAATRVKEYIWIVQILQTTAARTFSELTETTNITSAAVRNMDFTIAASRTGNDEILTLTATSSGSLPPPSADVSVYIEGLGGRDGLVQILA